MDMRKSLGEAFVKKHGVKIGFMSPFVRASAYALMDQPVVNAVIDGQDMVYRDFVDISVAVATPKVHKQAIQLKLRNSSVVKVNGVIIAGPGCTSSS
jgi:pyruvate/2-oxoglutarate dehydrogenase complex dihydrolipoamide acyltransferase (E2) component